MPRENIKSLALFNSVNIDIADLLVLIRYFCDFFFLFIGPGSKRCMQKFDEERETFDANRWELRHNRMNEQHSV